MCLSTIYRINNPECDIEDLMKIVQGPDFPTGGIISGVEGIKEMYETGRGKFQITSKYEIKEFNDHNEIVVSEIPYGINKKDLVFSIDKIRKNKDIDGINEVNDLSSGDSINIVIDLKKEINPNVVLQYLLNKTNLRVNYNANIVAICDKHPETLSLTRYLDVYIDFLREINLKQYKFDYEKTKARLHILDGLLKSVDIIDEIIKIIRNSVNKEDSKEKLMSIYKFSDVQAEAILNIRLYKLSHTDINILKDYGIDFRDASIKYLERIENSLEEIKEKLNAIEKKQDIYQAQSILNNGLYKMFTEINFTIKDKVYGSLWELATLELEDKLSEEELEARRYEVYKALLKDYSLQANTLGLENTLVGYASTVADAILRPNQADPSKDIFYYYDLTLGQNDKWVGQQIKNRRAYIAYCTNMLLATVNLAEFDMHYRYEEKPAARATYDRELQTMADYVNAVGTKFQAELKRLDELEKKMKDVC